MTSRSSERDSSAEAPPAFHTVIGVDCATKSAKTGLALAHRRTEGWRVLDVRDGAPRTDPAGIVADWMREYGPALVALDAPLGWPAPLGTSLVDHRPGDPIEVAPGRLFARETDRHVHAVYGKKPLDVGADRIARTAVAALALLHEVRRRGGWACPLWWHEARTAGAAAAEVYPAATLLAHGVRARGYKKDATGHGRQAVAELLAERLRLPGDFDAATCEDDAIDALLCVLAGVDIAEGRAAAPRADQREAAFAEGWIWVRKPDIEPSPLEQEALP